MIDDKIYEINFDALRNAIYHTARKGFLDRLNKGLSFIVILAGTTAVGDFAARLGAGGVFGDIKLYAAIAALAGAAQLVFDFGGAARRHEFLQHQYYDLIAKISEVTKPSDSEVARWSAELHRLYAEETPPMRALDSIAYNAAKESLNPYKGSRIKVKWFHALFAQFWQFNNSEFPWTNDPKANLSKHV
jgi:hypothetical protein